MFPFRLPGRPARNSTDSALRYTHPRRQDDDATTFPRATPEGWLTGSTPPQPGRGVGALAAKLARELPVTQHLGIRVEQWDADGLLLSAPLAANVNHQGTAFAGSVNALATLAGWGSLWLILREEEVEASLVLQDSSIRFLHPISRDLRARAPRPAPAAVRHLVESLRRHGKGRLSLDIEITDGGDVLATFRGRYVALRNGG